MGLAKDVVYPLKPPIFRSAKSHPGKAKSYEPKTLNETLLPIQDHTHSHPISTKEKEWGREKNRKPTPGARKSKKRKK